MGNSQWERDWNCLHNWESRAHRLHEVIGTHVSVNQNNVMVTEKGFARRISPEVDGT